VSDSRLKMIFTEELHKPQMCDVPQYLQGASSGQSQHLGSQGRNTKPEEHKLPIKPRAELHSKYTLDPTMHSI
jgi:hypothetical protein